MYRRDHRIEFAAQITDEASGRILHTLEPVLGDPQEPRPALAILRERIMAALAAAVDSRLGALASTGGQPPRYDAYLAFSTGVETLYPGRDARAALPYFQRAVALDSTYALPLIWAAWAHSGTALDQCDSTALIARRLASMHLTRLEQMQIDRVMARCRGDLAAAYALGRALTEAVPHSELMWEQFARDALDFDRPREAVTILERLHPDSGALDGRAGYYNWLTNAYHLLGEHDRELEAAQRAQRRFPRNLATLRMELLALAGLGHGREVKERLDEINALPPDPIRLPAPVMREIALDLAAHGDSAAARTRRSKRRNPSVSNGPRPTTRPGTRTQHACSPNRCTAPTRNRSNTRGCSACWLRSAATARRPPASTGCWSLSSDPSGADRPRTGARASRRSWASATRPWTCSHGPSTRATCTRFASLMRMWSPASRRCANMRGSKRCSARRDEPARSTARKPRGRPTRMPRPPSTAPDRPYFITIIFFVNRRPSTTNW